MNNKGFTLIEISVVVLLIGITLFVAGPTLRSTLLNNPLDDAGKLIISAVRELRNDSVRDQLDYVLHLDLVKNVFWITTADMTSEKKAEKKSKPHILPVEVVFADVTLPDGSKYTDGEVSVAFYKKGHATPAVIHLKKGDARKTIVIEPFLNQTGIYDKYTDFHGNEITG